MSEENSEDIRKKAKKFLKKAADIYDSVTFEQVKIRTGIEIKDLQKLIEKMFSDGKLKAEVKGNIIVFKKTPTVDITLPEDYLDVLKNIYDKLDDIKSDTELIKEYTSQIEEIFDKVDDLESFLKSNLGSDFSKIKHAWKGYKAGKIGKAGLIKAGIQSIGKKFIKNIIGKFI